MLSLDRLSLALTSLGVLGALAACDVYDSSLLQPSGGGTGTGATTSQGAGTNVGGEGGAPTCKVAGDCPGVDDECGTRTCVDGSCGVDGTPAGTAVTQQMAGDCLKQVCDGNGHTVGEPDAADVPNDNKECTTDSCVEGIPTFDPKAEGASCGAGGTKFCTVDSTCVECIDDIDCASMVCTDMFECAPAQCGDNVKNGNETDTDCGGIDCTACAIGDTCSVASDCLSNSCNVTCQPSCSDGILNQTESDVDCGGTCTACVFGQQCNDNTDCDTTSCGGGGTCTCAPNNGVLLLSEVLPRGAGGANDEFIELFNPGTTNVTFDNTWTLESRSEMAASYTVRYTGTGQVVQPGRHLLVVGTAYTGMVAGDATLASGITDEVSVVVKHNGTVVDALCINCGASTFTTQVCEGALFTKVGCTSNVDKSTERKPGGAQGNCIDTQDNASDFADLTPSNPQNLASPPTN